MRRFSLLALLFTLSGCASLPDVTYNYYPSRWNTSVTLIQTIGCNEKKDNIIALNSISANTSYSSDISKENLRTFRVKALERFSSDVDMSVTFTDDGRLRSINQSSTGQGEPIIKAFVALEGALTSMPMASVLKANLVENKPDIFTKCSDIEKWGDNKPITLVYRSSIGSKDIGKTVPLKIAEESKALFVSLEEALAEFSIIVDATPIQVESGVKTQNLDTDVVPLTLQKLATLSLKVNSIGSSDKTLWSSKVLIPLTETYEVPIPRAALFGKQSFSLLLSDSGAITNIGYGKTTGAIGGLNSLAAIANSQTAATEAAELKSQADVILQQQRLLICMTKKEQCK